jgi:hypothetical protein
VALNSKLESGAPMATPQAFVVSRLNAFRA